MKLPNYLLQMLNNENDTSIRIFGVSNAVLEMWALLKDKKFLLQKMSTPKSTMKNYLRGNRGIPIAICYKIAKEYCIQNKNDLHKIWEMIYERTNLFKSKSSGSRLVKLPKELTRELAYLVGALRDGCLATYSKNPNHFGVVLTQESFPSWLKNKIIPLMERMFELSITPRKEIQIYNKPLFKFFEKVFEMPPGNQGIWDTPKIIKKAPIEIQKFYIQGFFDAEGTCIPKEPLIGFFQKNKESLSFIKDTLKKIDIKSGKIGWDRRVWRFWISEKKSVKLFIQKIGTSHPDKLKRFNQFLTLSDS